MANEMRIPLIALRQLLLAHLLRYSGQLSVSLAWSRQRWSWKHHNPLLLGTFACLLLASWGALEQLALMRCDMDYWEAGTSRDPVDPDRVQPALCRGAEGNNQAQRQSSGSKEERWRVRSCSARTADSRECHAGETESDDVDAVVGAAAAAERKVCTFGNSEHYKGQF